MHVSVWAVGNVLHASDIHSTEEPLGLTNDTGEIHGGKVWVHLTCVTLQLGEIEVF